MNFFKTRHGCRDVARGRPRSLARLLWPNKRSSVIRVIWFSKGSISILQTRHSIDTSWQHGAVAFVVEDHDLPLVNIALTIRTGSFTAGAQATPWSGQPDRQPDA